LKKYFITPGGFDIDFESIISKHYPDFILYRDKSSDNYDTNAQRFVEICAKYSGVESFIHQDVDLAYKLKAKGVHLSSLQFQHIEYAKSLGLDVIVSTHTLDEVIEAQKKGADYVTYSPIFYSPGKGNPKGTEDLKSVVDKSDINIFALGGIISKKQIQEIENTDCYGFASIRYFYL